MTHLNQPEKYSHDMVLFSPPDMEQAAVVFDAMCGHGALAAALGIGVCDAVGYFEKGGWISCPAMEAAVRKAGKGAGRCVGWYWGGFPYVTLLQFLGPWMNPGRPAVARCQHRHWVARSGNLIWDANTSRWQPFAEWEAEIIPALMPKRGTGYEPFRSIICR